MILAHDVIICPFSLRWVRSLGLFLILPFPLLLVPYLFCISIIRFLWLFTNGSYSSLVYFILFFADMISQTHILSDFCCFSSTKRNSIIRCHRSIRYYNARYKYCSQIPIFEGSIDLNSSVSVIVRSNFSNLVIQHYSNFDSINSILSYYS